jgi:hypothetical protein
MREYPKISTRSRRADRACRARQKTAEARQWSVKLRPSPSRDTLHRVARHVRGEAFARRRVKAPSNRRDGRANDGAVRCGLWLRGSIFSPQITKGFLALVDDELMCHAPGHRARLLVLGDGSLEPFPPL